MAYNPITLLCISFIFIEMKFIHYHSGVMFVMKSMNICNDYVNYDEIMFVQYSREIVRILSFLLFLSW